MRNYRLGIWAGIAGIATILIVGGMTIWMVAIIIGLIIGLLSSYNDSISTPQDGLRFGAINGAVAGAPQLNFGFGAFASALVAGLVGMLITAVVGGALSAGQHLKGPARPLAVAAIVGAYLVLLPQIDSVLKLG